MKTNEIFEVENVESAEEVKVLGKCCICGKVITDDEDDYCEVYNPENDDYELLCGDCNSKRVNNLNICTYCSDWKCVLKGDSYETVWTENMEKTYICKMIIEHLDYKQCEKCGTYCHSSILEESGLCPDCEEEAEEE